MLRIANDRRPAHRRRRCRQRHARHALRPRRSSEPSCSVDGQHQGGGVGRDLHAVGCAAHHHRRANPERPLSRPVVPVRGRLALQLAPACSLPRRRPGIPASAATPSPTRSASSMGRMCMDMFRALHRCLLTWRERQRAIQLMIPTSVADHVTRLRGSHVLLNAVLRGWTSAS